MHDSGAASASTADATRVEDMLQRLEHDLPALQSRHSDLFALANAWTERHDAILASCPPGLRADVQQRLQRLGIRWGLAPGARVTREFSALAPRHRRRRP